MFSHKHPSRNFYPAVFFQSDPPPSGNPEPAPKTQPQPEPEPKQSALEKALTDILARNNNNESEALRTLVGQVHKLTQRAETAEAKIGKVPDDVQKELDDYRAFGKPDEIKTRLEAEAALTAKEQQREKREVLDKAVKAAGLDANGIALLNGALDLEFVAKTEKVDGKDAEVWYAKATDGAEMPVLDVLKANYTDAVIDRFKVEQKAGGVRINPALSGAPLDPKVSEEAARKGQGSLYSSS